MKLHYNATGPDRKELVQTISKLLGIKPVYKGMPTSAYEIGTITVEKDGTVVYDEHTDQDTIEAIIIALDVHMVQRLAYERNYFELVVFLEEHRKEYVRFILYGDE